MKRAAARAAAVAAVPTEPTAAVVPESGVVAMEVVDDTVPAPRAMTEQQRRMWRI